MELVFSPVLLLGHCNGFSLYSRYWLIHFILSLLQWGRAHESRRREWRGRGRSQFHGNGFLLKLTVCAAVSWRCSVSHQQTVTQMSPTTETPPELKLRFWSGSFRVYKVRRKFNACHIYSMRDSLLILEQRWHRHHSSPMTVGER